MTDLGTIENYKRIGVNIVPIKKGDGKNTVQKYIQEIYQQIRTLQ
jgi:hypothetical protein